MRSILYLLLMITTSGSDIAAEKQYEIYDPVITRGFMYPPGELLYNHDSTIEYFQGRFYGAWNGNENRWEGRPGQKNYWAWSDDGLNWSPAVVFTNVPPFGFPTWQTEWQPLMLNWKDEELWCFWTKSGGLLFSKLNETKDGWDHSIVWKSVILKGRPYHTFPTQNPTVLEDGSVMIPCVFNLPSEIEPDYHKRTYYSGPVITRDGGKTFFVPEDALIEHPEVDKNYKLWEPMYVIQDDKNIRMFNRTYSMGFDSSQLPTNALVTALGSADGETMGAPYYSAIRTVHSRMWLGYYGTRRLMLHSDSMKHMFPRDRINISLFSSRTGRDDFVAGIPVEDDLIGIAYPQAVVVSNAAYVCYTHQYDPATIVVNKVEPLPEESKWYIFPRSGNRSLTGNDQPRPVAATGNEPEHLEFYTAAYEVESGVPNNLGTNSVTITGWLAIKPKSDGVIFNALSPDGLSGFSLRFNFNGRLILTFGGPDKGEDIELPYDPVKTAGYSFSTWWDYTPWVYFAISFDNQEGKTYYWSNKKMTLSGKRFEPNKDLSTGLIPGFVRPQDQLYVKNHYPLFAKVHSIKVYDRVLTDEEVNHDYTRFPGISSSGISTRNPGTPSWSLSKASYDKEFLAVKNNRPLSMPVERKGEILTFSGNSAAGVDLELFNPESDAVEISLPVTMKNRPVSDTVILLTMGDYNDVMIGLHREDPDHVYINYNGEWIQACKFNYAKENTVKIRISKSRITVANDGDSVSVANDSIGQRLYIGDGYPSFYINPEDQFSVDVSKFYAKVIRNGLAADLAPNVNLRISESFSTGNSSEDYSDAENFNSAKNKTVQPGTAGFEKRPWMTGTALIQPRDFRDLTHALMAGETAKGCVYGRPGADGIGRSVTRRIAATLESPVIYMSGLVRANNIIDSMNPEECVVMGMFNNVAPSTFNNSSGLGLGLMSDEPGKIYLTASAAGNIYKLGNAITAAQAPLAQIIVLRLEINKSGENDILTAWIAHAGETELTEVLTVSDKDIVKCSGDLKIFVVQNKGGPDSTTALGVILDEFRLGVQPEDVTTMKWN